VVVEAPVNILTSATTSVISAGLVIAYLVGNIASWITP
jgi:hypothetical protein